MNKTWTIQIIFLVVSYLFSANCKWSFFSEKVQSEINAIISSNSSKLDLSGWAITRKELADIAEFLININHHITSLDLSENDLSEIDEVSYFFDLLGFTDISHLNVRNCHLKFGNVIPSTNEYRPNKLVMLDLSKNKFSYFEFKKLVKQLRLNSIFTELRLNSMNLSNNHIKLLAKELNKTQIRSISLDDNQMTIKNFESLLTTLLDKKINFSVNGNNLGDDGATFMLNQLKKYNKTEFILRNNKIGINGIISMIKVLKDSNFTSLDIAENNLSPSAVSILSRVIKYTKIRNLTLNSVTDISTLNFWTLELFASDFSTFDSSMMNKIINYLDINRIYLHLYKRFKEVDAKKIIDRLKFTNVYDLSLNFYSIHVNEYEAIAIAKILKSLHLKTFKVTFAESFDAVAMGILIQVLPEIKLKSLKLINNKIDVDEMTALTRVLRDTELQALDLGYNAKYSYEHERELNILMENLIGSKIKTLDFDDVLMGIGVELIINKLNKTNISKLSLIHNYINDNHLKALSRVLPSTRITELYLNNNLINGGVKDLAKVLKDTQIYHLNLEENFIDNDSANVIANVLCETKVIDLRIKSSLTKFQNETIFEKIYSCLKRNRAKLYENDETITFQTAK